MTSCVFPSQHMVHVLHTDHVNQWEGDCAHLIMQIWIVEIHRESSLFSLYVLAGVKTL